MDSNGFNNFGSGLGHRGSAGLSEASRFLIDEIKRTVPIWKHEIYEDGTSEWVRC